MTIQALMQHIIVVIDVCRKLHWLAGLNGCLTVVDGLHRSFSENIIIISSSLHQQPQYCILDASIFRSFRGVINEQKTRSSSISCRPCIRISSIVQNLVLLLSGDNRYFHFGSRQLGPSSICRQTGFRQIEIEKVMVRQIRQVYIFEPGLIVEFT